LSISSGTTTASPACSNERGVGRRGAVGVERRPEVRRLDRLGLALRSVGEGDRARRRAAQLDRERVAARRRDGAGVRGDDEDPAGGGVGSGGGVGGGRRGAALPNRRADADPDAEGGGGGERGDEGGEEAGRHRCERCERGGERRKGGGVRIRPGAARRAPATAVIAQIRRTI
jgi:hypothetical protein